MHTVVAAALAGAGGVAWVLCITAAFWATGVHQKQQLQQQPDWVQLVVVAWVGFRFAYRQLLQLSSSSSTMSPARGMQQQGVLAGRSGVCVTL
jgi:hypothetical protein